MEDPQRIHAAHSAGRFARPIPFKSALYANAAAAADGCPRCAAVGRPAFVFWTTARPAGQGWFRAERRTPPNEFFYATVVKNSAPIARSRGRALVPGVA